MFGNSIVKTVLVLVSVAKLQGIDAHGSHGHADAAPKDGQSVDNENYAVRHMHSEHHLDAFDAPSFFHIHDLNRDGSWDREEIEAVYGVHHVYSQKKSPDEESHRVKADQIVNKVLLIYDKDMNGKISLSEFEMEGIAGLPSFDDLGAEGHHYDVESEFFLHHEEQFHATPETQTDEAYTHPEDLEHFSQHESIERKENEKEAKFIGITTEELEASIQDAINSAQQQHNDPAQNSGDPSTGAETPGGSHAQIPPDYEKAPHPHGDQPDGQKPMVKPKIDRSPPPNKQDPKDRYRNVVKADPAWGEGESGFKAPKQPSDRLRRNLPYKYKFRRNWGDF